MNKIYYSQLDSRWATHPYPSNEKPGATIASGGCGVACASMVVSMLKQIITPSEIADMFLRDGIRVNGGTSNRAFDSYLTEKFGLKCEKKWKLDEAVNCLNNGGIVVARCTKDNGTLFTTDGHFIVLVEYKNNEFLVFDSFLYKDKFNCYGRNGQARIEGTNVYVGYQNMKDFGGYAELWCYDSTGVDTNVDNSVPASVNRGTVGSVNKLANNCNLYSEANLSGTVYNYLKNTSFKILENVSERVDKIQVIQTGRIAYVDISNYANAQSASYRVMTVTAKSGLNVRTGPGTNYQRITTYKYGTQVKVYSIENGWAKGTKGYMCATYLR